VNGARHMSLVHHKLGLTKGEKNNIWNNKIIWIWFE